MGERSGYEVRVIGQVKGRRSISALGGCGCGLGGVFVGCSIYLIFNLRSTNSWKSFTWYVFLKYRLPMQCRNILYLVLR